MPSQTRLLCGNRVLSRGTYLIGKSRVFLFGHLHASEIRRLIAEGNIDPQEAAAIIAQVDILNDVAGDVAIQQHNQPGLLRILAIVGDCKRIEAMLLRKVKPRIVRQIRKRRFRSYCVIWRAARMEFLRDSAALRNEYAEASEWPMYMREEARLISAHYLFASLYVAGVAYRFGFRPDIAALVARVTALLATLPHRGDCPA